MMLIDLFVELFEVFLLIHVSDRMQVSKHEDMWWLIDIRTASNYIFCLNVHITTKWVYWEKILMMVVFFGNIVEPVAPRKAVAEDVEPQSKEMQLGSKRKSS